jgi:hypothetical protein
MEFPTIPPNTIMTRESKTQIKSFRKSPQHAVRSQKVINLYLLRNWSDTLPMNVRCRDESYVTKRV